MRYSGIAIPVSALFLAGCAWCDRPDTARGRSELPARFSSASDAGHDGRRSPAVAADPAPNAAVAERKAAIPAAPDSRPTGGGAAATRGYAPLAVDGLIRHGLNGRPLADALIEVVDALSGAGLPLRSTGKNADPATLLRVRGDAVMLLWRSTN